ncbi:hypothetical protein OSB04_003561 [Centaurea solstitialis]|uniref:Homeobox domain-containing protein n=1 Tax=Centaurea solstitialis TaxID=347529 RepID=A0AA38U6S9_9ASTR|nr:hypothetical protein OSB04_003561 [Centaurea solstitialis]
MADNEQELNQHHHHQNQKLSLSLGSGLLFPSSTTHYRGERWNFVSDEELQEKTRKSFNPSPYSSSSSSLNSTFYGMEPLSISIGSSRYLKPTQSLLDEMVSIGGKDLDSSNKSYAHKLSSSGWQGSLGLCSELKAELCSNGLSMEKQELQATLAKLISLLEEWSNDIPVYTGSIHGVICGDTLTMAGFWVGSLLPTISRMPVWILDTLSTSVERRYEQYYQELEDVVSSFELVAGLGSGKPYTSLTLNAMSVHFSGLKDAILGQIYATRKKILQDLPKINTGFSQLSLFDKESNRHNRIALQQLGMIASPAKRGDPFGVCPKLLYPNDNEKLMLASQTGLSKNQVSNWFINARVRLWKPMIEEMYKEEFADSSEDSNL